tara:strand:- start:62 stop:1159 length:1098 start_codon:yes stop_codon:yes gene_type:complete
MISRTIEIGKKILSKNGLPSHIVLFITNRCNMECDHCFLVESGELNDLGREQILSLENIRKLAISNPKLLALSITGGEPFLKKDLSKIIKIFAESGYLKSINIVSNGYQTNEILKGIKKILNENKIIDIFLSISLDGDSETHNIIRKKHNAYANAINTIRGLSKISKNNKRLSIGVNSTYIGSNFDSICQLYTDLNKVELNYVSLNLVRGVTWQSKPREIDINEYKELCYLKEKLIISKKKQSSFMNSLMTTKGKLMTNIIADTYQKDCSISDCYAGSLFGVIKDNGDVFACEQLSRPIGNLSKVNYDLSKIWFSEAAKKQRLSIRNHECHCTYECVSSCNIFFNPKYYPFLLKEIVSIIPFMNL